MKEKEVSKMKNVIFALVLLSVCITPNFASGSDEEGIWGNFDIVPLITFMGVTVPEVVFMLREENDIVIVAEIKLNEWTSQYGWEAYFGSKSNNVVRVTSTEYSTVNFDATITFHTPTTATMHINNCTSNITECDFSTGSNVSLIKIL